MDILLESEDALRLDHTLRTGQVFRWREERDGRWYGSIGGTALALQQHGCRLRVDVAGDAITPERIRAFLGLDDPLPLIREHLARDPLLDRAFASYYGLRVVRQDPWEALAAFICSSRNTVSRIERMTASLAQHFGKRLEIAGQSIHTFPSPAQIAGLTVEGLAPCRLGYRDRYILAAARMVADGTVDLQALSSASYGSARQELMRLPGVGPKVGDCVLLTALGAKDSAFPVDVWVGRAVSRYYRDAVQSATQVRLPPDGKLTNRRQYDAIVAWAQLAFAPYAGYAQAYLFLAARTGII